MKTLRNVLNYISSSICIKIYTVEPCCVEGEGQEGEAFISK
jgi:hypothetical protein